MEFFGKQLEEHGIPYIWLIFTNDGNAIQNKNIIYKEPELDIMPYIKEADYLIQLSNQRRAVIGYAPVEALSVGTPVIVTECDSFLEIGVKDGENGFVVDFDMQNINYMDIYEKRLKFDFKAKEDGYKNILVKSKNTYKEDLQKIVPVKCIQKYINKEGETIIPGDVLKMNLVRAEGLEERKLVEILWKN